MASLISSPSDSRLSQWCCSCPNDVTVIFLQLTFDQAFSFFGEREENKNRTPDNSRTLLMRPPVGHKVAALDNEVLQTREGFSLVQVAVAQMGGGRSIKMVGYWFHCNWSFPLLDKSCKLPRSRNVSVHTELDEIKITCNEDEKVNGPSCA